MKKSIIAAVAAGIMTIAGMAAVKTVSHEASLFERNVEALSYSEKDFDKAKWIVHRWENGDFNCTDGGKERCAY